MEMEIKQIKFARKLICVVNKVCFYSYAVETAPLL